MKDVQLEPKLASHSKLRDDIGIALSMRQPRPALAQAGSAATVTCTVHDAPRVFQSFLPARTIMAPSSEEREMTTHQRSLVNNCFEEGQYESGMAVLDQLRSSSFIPPPYVFLNAILDPDLIAFEQWPHPPTPLHSSFPSTPTYR